MKAIATAGRLLGVSFALLLTIPAASAKLSPQRWGELSEEERHQMTRAERYVDQNNFKSALGEYELFLQLHGRSDAASYAQFMFAECTRRLGKVNTAINEFRSVIDYFPDTIDAGAAQYSIGVCLMQGGDAEKAAAAFEKVVAQWPKEKFGAQARNELCTIYWRLGKIEAWLPHIDYLATGEYSDTQHVRHNAQRRLFQHRLTTNQVPEAYALIQKVRAKDSLSLFADWASHALRGNTLSDIYGDKIRKSIPAIAIAVVQFIERQPVPPDEQASVNRNCARMLAAAGLTEQANAHYVTLLKATPDNDSLRLEYSGYLRGNKQYEEARLIYRDLNDTYRADREIAETYREENNLKHAIELYQAMLEKHPDQGSATQWRLAELLQYNRQYPEAIASYQLSQRDPQALFRIADCQGAMKKPDAAIQTLVGVMNFFKDHAAEAQYKIAGYQGDKGDKEAAIRTLKTVCKVYLKTPWAGRAHQDLSLKYGVEVTLGGAAKTDDS